MSERDDMKLPDGKSCEDCAHYMRCQLLIGPTFINERSTTCDWSPSRFRPRPPPGPPPPMAMGL